MNNKAFYPYYKKMLEQEYRFRGEVESKPIWRWIHEKRLTACPAFVGTLYEESNLRLMVVGRAVNGWDRIDTERCTSLENAVESALAQEECFDDVVNPNGIPYIDSKTGKEKRYYYSRSKFWKLIRCILDIGGDGRDFNHKIVWSNLYKVAPFVTGNPNWGLIKPQMQNYIDCLIEEIHLYKPTHILFMTGMDYLNPWSDEETMPCFGEYFGIGKDNSFGDDVYRVGEFEGAKVVVCGRPEGKSNDAIQVMAKEILCRFGVNTEKK